MIVAGRLTCACPRRSSEGGKNGATHPPPPSPDLPAASPPREPPAADDASALARRRARRIATWAVCAALVLLGLYLYFAEPRSGIPLRVAP